MERSSPVNIWGEESSRHRKQQVQRSCGRNMQMGGRSFEEASMSGTEWLSEEQG